MRSSRPEPRPSLELPRGLAPLGYRNFALYLVGQVVSNSGKWIEVTGSVWLLSDLSGSPILLGLLGLFRGIPSIVLGAIAGAIADRVDQRKLLFTTQALGMVASLCVGVLVASGLIQIWHLYVQVAIQGGIEAFDTPVRQALFPRLVPRARRAEAVTLSTTAGRASQLVGPAAGGLAIAGLGVAAPFLLNAGSFIVLMTSVIFIRGVVPRTPGLGSTLTRELVEGLRYIAATPVLRGLLQMEVVFSVFGMNPVMITILGREVLGVGPQELGGLLSAPALGSIIGIAGLLVLRPPTRQGRFVILAIFAYVGALIAVAESKDYVISALALVATGAFDVLESVARQSAMQLSVPGRMRGRVMGSTRMATGGLSQLGQTQSGILSGIIGGPLAVLGAAAALSIAAAISASTNPALWRFSGAEANGRPPTDSSDASEG